MLGTHLAALTAAEPTGVGPALDIVTGFDEALAHGLARLGEERASALTAFAGALAATPLGERAGEAVEKVVAGSISDEHLMTLAAGRTAVLGAVHDALLAHFDDALGRRRAAWPDVTDVAPDPAPNLLAGARSWLRELAIAGWRGVDHDLVSAAAQTVQALLAQPSRRRLALLLDGLAGELRAAGPIATMPRLPVRRWADLWSRAQLLAQPELGAPPAEPVSGRLLILGADVHEHATAIQVQVHGVLEGDAGPRLVRASVSATKVDTIVGSAVWKLLHQHNVLRHALAKHTSLKLTDMPLLPGGDLIWDDDRAWPDGEADPFTSARLHLGAATAPPVPPLFRHPVAIAEPVLLSGYTVADGVLTLDGGALPIELGRLPSCGPLTRELVAASTECIGLVRWDAGAFRLQPLALRARVKKADVTVHSGDWAQGATDQKVLKAESRAGDPVGVLTERAGRLLRK